MVKLDELGIVTIICTYINNIYNSSPPPPTSLKPDKVHKFAKVSNK